MNREQLTREEIKIPEVQETQEVLVERIEFPEDLRIQMLAESKKETDSIKVECADGLVRVEERASKE